MSWGQQNSKVTVHLLPRAAYNTLSGLCREFGVSLRRTCTDRLVTAGVEDGKILGII